jgi:hypothetical protein
LDRGVVARAGASPGARQRGCRENVEARSGDDDARRHRLAMVMLVPTAPITGPTRPASSPLTNSLRSSKGLAPLAVDGTLVSVARSWSGKMAAAGTISRNPSLSSGSSGWRRPGERRQGWQRRRPATGVRQQPGLPEPVDRLQLRGIGVVYGRDDLRDGRLHATRRVGADPAPPSPAAPVRRAPLRIGPAAGTCPGRGRASPPPPPPPEPKYLLFLLDGCARSAYKP